MTASRYKRILLKLSGAFLAPENGSFISLEALDQTAELIARDYRDHQPFELVIVMGGGNLMRGRTVENTLSETAAHSIGLISTVVNAIALADALTNHDVKSRAVSTLHTPPLIQTFRAAEAEQLLAEDTIVVVGGGTAPPNFGVTTDTAGVVIGHQLNCDLMIKATDVDGVYDRDPQQFPDARRFETITYDKALEKNIKVMDQTAFALAREFEFPIRVFDFTNPAAFSRLLNGDDIGTTIS